MASLIACIALGALGAGYFFCLAMALRSALRGED
jgi:hypothetical protein